MINSLHLGNFKAFAETQKIPVKPITLIFGANSAGKSSIIHSLALAHEAIRTGELDLFRTDLGGSSVDLGGFRQYIHRRQANRRMDWRLTLNTTKFQGRLKELLEPVSEITAGVTIGMPLDDMDQPLPGASPQIFSYELESDGNTLLRMSRRPAGHLALDLLPYRHPVLQRIIKALLEGFTTTGKITDKDIEGLETPIGEIIANLRAPMGTFFPKGLKDHSKEEDGEARQLSLFPVSKGYRQEDLAKALHFFLPRTLDELIRELNSQLQSEINRLQYLGPLRSYPARHFAFAEHEDINWYAGGGYAWDVVRRNHEVRSKVNTWLCDKEKLSTPYELSIRNLLTVDDIGAEYEKLSNEYIEEMLKDLHNGDGWDHGESIKFITNVFEKLKNTEMNYSDIQELVLVDRRTDTQVSHRDVGIGVSQLLPVLVAAYASQQKIIAIEQPGIHLHPALKAEIGDLFIASALGENRNTFLIETHSEHLILRILRRIRETTDGELPADATPITPEQLAVLYVQPVKEGSKVINIPVNENGEFDRPWPQGFFAERAKELF
jgi:predicted ATPase